MKAISKITTVLLLAAGMMLVCGCRKNGPFGGLTVKMTDTPAAYSEINVEVIRLEVHYADEKMGSAGWIGLNTKAGVYNMLLLQNDVTAVLTDDTRLPLGKITQLRLILGGNNSVVEINSQVRHPLVIPGGDIKLNVDSEIDSNKALQIILDFEASGSINLTGNGTYQMNPVVIKVQSVMYN